jgi:putative transcriptional regulator
MPQIKSHLRHYRERFELTQDELAVELGITRQTVHALEQGKYLPTLSLAFRIANHFDVPIEEIFSYKE